MAQRGVPPKTASSWLDLAHIHLDQVFFAVYGWPKDLSDEEILEKLLAPKEQGGSRITVG